MNSVNLMGRLTKDPEVRYSTGDKPTAIAKYSIAVNRAFKKDEADFINIVAFGKDGEFAEKFFKKGDQVGITGRIQTGNYTNKENQKVYTTDVIVEHQYFAQTKSSGGESSSRSTKSNTQPTTSNGFMNIPDGIDEELPFN
jgi:single-strand DNA-binding protein